MKTLLGIDRGIQKLGVLSVLLALALAAIPFSTQARAQDQDDPPGRVGRLGYTEGSVSFQPAGEDEWVEAVHNRPMTTGDKVWADRDSRAEVQLGSATIHLGPSTGFSFLNLDDRTIQIQLSTGSLNVRVRDLDRDNVFEIDTPNLAFTVYRPGQYRVDASENGDYTVVTLREGEGEATGNGQSFTMHSGQRFTFRGTNALNAEVEQIGPPDEFDRWGDARERRYEDSPSARYCSRRVVGYSDLDDYGDWQPTPDYGYVWFPRVDAGWAPYHHGHWAWIDPWGWTWVEDEPWGYAPFHYGRWSYWRGRWGWVPGPREERPVYAPALVAFVGGAFVAGATVAWFPLGPREVYVPSYRVSETYVNRVNVTNTTVNTTVIKNVYNTTIVNNNTTINNVNYVNRNVQGAVVAVPQRTFVSSQPVARNTVAVDTSEMRTRPVMARAAVPPGRESVLGVRANTAGRVAAPPQTVVSRPVIAKTAPPPPSPSFAARQQVLAQHPGQPISRPELQKMRSATPPPSAPVVKQAPPARPGTPQPAMNRPGNQPGPQPGNPATNARPGNPPAAQPQPAPAPGANNRPFTPPGSNDRPPTAQPNRPQPNQPNNAAQPPARNERPESAQPNNRPEPNQPNNRPQPTPPVQPQPSNRPFTPPGRNDRPPSAQPNNRPEPNQPAPNDRPQPTAPTPPPARNERPESAQPNYRPEPNRPQPNVPQANQPMPDNRPTPTPRPETSRPEPNRPEPPARNERPPQAQPNNRPAEQPRYEPPPRTQTPPQQERPQPRPAPESRPAPPPQRESRPAPPPQQESPEQKEQKKHPEDPNKKPQ